MASLDDMSRRNVNLHRLGSRIVCRRSSVFCYLSDARSGPFCTFLVAWGRHAVNMRMPHGQLSPVHSTPSTFPPSHHPPTHVPVSSYDIPHHGGPRRDRGGRASISKSRGSDFLTCPAAEVAEVTEQDTSLGKTQVPLNRST